jgi:hypothetical protein
VRHEYYTRFSVVFFFFRYAHFPSHLSKKKPPVFFIAINIVAGKYRKKKKKEFRFSF